MFYAYVLKSIHHNFFYKGHCGDLEERVRQHNAGMTPSTRPYIPLQLVYFEAFPRELAIAREKYFKSSAGRRLLKKKLAS